MPGSSDTVHDAAGSRPSLFQFSAMTDARSYSTIVWPVSRRSERPRAGFPCGSAVGVEAVQYRLWRKILAPIPTFTWTFRLSICAASRWYSWVSVDVPKGAGDANAVGCGTTVWS